MEHTTTNCRYQEPGKRLSKDRSEFWCGYEDERWWFADLPERRRGVRNSSRARQAPCLRGCPGAPGWVLTTRIPREGATRHGVGVLCTMGSLGFCIFHPNLTGQRRARRQLLGEYRITELSFHKFWEFKWQNPVFLALLCHKVTSFREHCSVITDKSSDCQRESEEAAAKSFTWS